MSKINLLITILPRDVLSENTAFFEPYGVQTVFSVPCQGTAGRGLLNLLGLEQTEKMMHMTLIPSSRRAEVTKGLCDEWELNKPGNGILCAVPLDGMGGETVLKALLGNQPYDLTREEENNMQEQKSEAVLIVAIADIGSSDLVMQAARSAGAGGGTIVHAKGTAGALTKKFLGISLASEKELVLILASRENRNPIMRAIMDDAGISSSAHAVVFSVPVDQVEGIRLTRPEPEKPVEEEPQAEKA